MDEEQKISLIKKTVSAIQVPESNVVESVGKPYREILLTTPDGEDVVYGIWKRTAPNLEDNKSLEKDFIMLVRKIDGEYRQENVQFFPATLLSAMLNSLKPPKILQIRKAKIFCGDVITGVLREDGHTGRDQVACLVMAPTMGRAKEMVNKHYNINSSYFDSYYGETGNPNQLALADDLLSLGITEALWLGDSVVTPKMYRRIL